MGTTTKNLNLTKDYPTDHYDVGRVNENSDKIDSAIGDYSNITPKDFDGEKNIANYTKYIDDKVETYNQNANTTFGDISDTTLDDFAGTKNVANLIKYTFDKAKSGVDGLKDTVIKVTTWSNQTLDKVLQSINDRLLNTVRPNLMQGTTSEWKDVIITKSASTPYSLGLSLPLDGLKVGDVITVSCEVKTENMVRDTAVSVVQSLTSAGDVTLWESGTTFSCILDFDPTVPSTTKRISREITISSGMLRNIKYSPYLFLAGFSSGKFSIRNIKVEIGKGSTPYIPNPVDSLNSTIPTASNNNSGLMASADKSKLDSIDINRSNLLTQLYPDGQTFSTRLNARYFLITKNNGDCAIYDSTTSSYVTSWNTAKYLQATSTSDGLMSSTDKTKLDNINIANYYTKTESNNTFYNKNEVDSKLATKAGLAVATNNSNGLLSSADKAKLDAYETKIANLEAKLNDIATNGAKLKTEVASGGLSIFLNDDWKIRWMDDGSLRREYIPTKTQSATNMP